MFLPDRPENRLLKTALDKICTHTQVPENWRLAHELAGQIAEIPRSRQVTADFKCWGNDRLMAHYQTIKPWCELILGENMPLAVHGETRGISLLFPMEKLFEAYVEVCLRRQLMQGTQLKAQVASQHLCKHQDQNIFQLNSDFMLIQGMRTTPYHFALSGLFRLNSSITSGAKGSSSSMRLFGQVGSFSSVFFNHSAGFKPLSLVVPSKV